MRKLGILVCAAMAVVLVPLAATANGADFIAAKQAVWSMSQSMDAAERLRTIDVFTQALNARNSLATKITLLLIALNLALTTALLARKGMPEVVKRWAGCAGRALRAPAMISVLLSLAGLAAFELVLANALPGENQILTARTLVDPAAAYPATASDYLPWTTPRAMSVPHHSGEFDVTYRFDADGYRTSDWRDAYSGGASQGTVLFLGDSFTLGWGVAYDDSFAGLVGEYLAGRGLRTVDAGYRAGYSPDAYLAYLLRDGAALKPRTVVTMIYAGNDLDDIENNLWLATDPRGYPTRIAANRLVRDFRGRLVELSDLTPEWFFTPVLNKSYLYMGVRNLLNPAKMKTVVDTMAEIRARKEPGGAKPDGLARLRLSVAGITDFCTANRAQCIIGVIRSPYGRRGTDEAARYGQIVDSVRASGAKVVDLGPVVPPAGYFPQDGHYNELGHLLAAQALLKALDGN